MGLRLPLCWCLVFAFALAIAASSARNTFSLPGDEMMMVATAGRSLKVSTDDYGDPSANRGHDPRNRVGGSGGGRKNRDIP
ncbi:hypothetical protein L1049_013914 [Liquidambar formosana]|uniref:Uncharacterized protein n=1 Tax=Liquidambar formosana TaxID=63359 RepID=A0AAP0RL92_LIQFO